MGGKGPRSSLGLPLLPDEVEEVLSEDQHTFANLMEWQPLSPEHSPCCLPDAKSPL